ncbi:MAG: ketoacyl-ACP synthase III [Ignavibacteriae bacterium]|nr:ketoacyl-ACP synthase III [Ignavibacteriota bacterium]
MSKLTKCNAYVSAVGHWMPEKIVNNQHFTSYLDTTDEWIKARTGITERRFLEDDQPTSYAAVKAIEATLKNRGISAEEIDLILVATVSPDMIYPSTACIVQNKIGAKNCWGYDILAACSGFIFALATGTQFVESGMHKKVIVVGAEKMSAIVDMQDRNTCVLFGDGAAAFLLEPTEDKSIGILDSILHIDGSGGSYLCQPAGGSLHPTSHETVDKGMQFVHQEGQAVFKAAVKGMADVAVEIMERNNLKADDVAFLVPHQANMRIIQVCAERVKVGMDKVMLNIHKYGNTTSATIPSCVSEYYQAGKLKKGDYIILSSFGAGWTWGAILLKWAI